MTKGTLQMKVTDLEMGREPGGSNPITEVLKTRQPFPAAVRERHDDVRRIRETQGLKMEEGSTSQAMQVASRSLRGMKTDSPPEPPDLPTCEF